MKKLLRRAGKRFNHRFGGLEVRPRYLRFAYFLAGFLAALLVALVFAWLRAPDESEREDPALLRQALTQARQRLAQSEGIVSNLEVTASANQRLRDELRYLSDERARLEGDLLHFLPRVPAGTQEGQAKLERLSALKDPRVENAWNFSVWTGFYSGREAREFVGRLVGTYTVLRAGKTLELPWPAPGAPVAESEVRTRQWARKTGVLPLQAGDQLKKLKIDLLQTNRVVASTSIDFSGEQ
ncbi:MAG: hypothetical protein LBL69_04850 [Zoogloeaceae bacterium]|jgi:hypothetical protein|nr:hypothetical protein [Zoogloeaceae bacterium]